MFKDQMTCDRNNRDSSYSRDSVTPHRVLSRLSRFIWVVFVTFSRILSRHLSRFRVSVNHCQ